MEVEIEISDSAQKMIQSYLDWWEARNTPGSGVRFYVELDAFLWNLTKSFPYYSPCANQILKSKNLFCTQFRTWLIPFRVHDQRINIIGFIHIDNLISEVQWTEL